MDTRAEELLLRLKGTGAFFRPRDVGPLGVSHAQIQHLVAEGAAERVARGLYRRSNIEPTELETVAMISAAVPGAIVCLLTALSFQGIGTQLPHEVWIAISRKSRKPTCPPARVRVVRFSGVMLTHGVDEEIVQGVRVAITSPTRTVVDCFRYRHKIGIDVALEALADLVHSRKASIAEIARTAEVCQVGTVMRPYLESLSS